MKNLGGHSGPKKKSRGAHINVSSHHPHRRRNIFVPTRQPLYTSVRIYSYLELQRDNFFVVGLLQRQFTQMFCVTTGISSENLRQIEQEIFELFDFL